MLAPLREIRKGEDITANFLNSLVRQLRALIPQRSGDIVPSITPNGTTYKLTRHSRGGGGDSTDTPLSPFEIYRAPPSNPVQGTDWRTFQVHYALCSNVAVNNTDQAASPIRIIVPSQTAHYKIWVHVTINITNSTVTTATIESGATTPAQPAGDSTTGAPPSDFYLTIGEVSTGSDTIGDSNYHQFDIEQGIHNSQWIDVVGYEIECSDLNGIILLKRISSRAV